MKRLTHIILHCSDSSWGSSAEIRKWHLEKGWKDIGYHFVIDNGFVRPDFFIPAMDGTLEVGRMLDADSFISDNEIGAHTLGYNNSSIGICLIGTKSFTEKQFATLLVLLDFLITQFGIKIEHIIGHNETESGKQQGKSCPNFEVETIRNKLRS